MPTTYYIRKTGSDAAAGTSAGAAWLTFGKALGASGIASGDTVYVGAGVYREVVSVAMTSATVETFVIGDVDGVQTGDMGEVQLTAYTTNDTTAPSSTTLLDLNGRDFLTFQKIVFIGGNALMITGTTATSTDIKFTKCSFVVGYQSGGSIISHTTAANVAANWTIDSCIFVIGTGSGLQFTFTRPATADFDYNILIKNCLFFSGSNATTILTSSTGANAFKSGGLSIYNCTSFGGGSFLSGGSNVSTSFPLKVYNCFLHGGNGTRITGSSASTVLEDYNIILSATATNVVVVISGGHSITNGSYAPLFFTGHEYVGIGSNLMPFGMPKPSSPLLAFGNQASSPTVDILGITRPATPGVGCYELGQGGVRETSTVRTGANALKIASAGYNDFDVPVSGSVSTTITIYARYDSNYAGTLPTMNIVNGTECGVADATAIQVGAANTWEQLSLNFTPSTNGIITVRLISSSTASNGNAYFDDFDVT